MSRSVRDNPPDTIITVQEFDKYKSLYDDIVGNGVPLKFSHRHALAELAVSLVEMQNLRAQLLEGEWVEVQGDRHIIRKRNPARDALDKLRTSTMRMFKEFKMTPASMGKQLSAPPGQAEISSGIEDDFDQI